MLKQAQGRGKGEVSTNQLSPGPGETPKLAGKH